MQKLMNTLLVFSLLAVGAGCTSNDVEDVIADDQQPTEEVTDNTMQYEFPGVLDAGQIENKQARITTDKGEIVFTLFGDTAPMAVSNFVYLANQGYYDGLTFHRRVEGFVIQGGDPSGDGTGGPGYDFEDELTDDYTYTQGIVAMANRGSDTNGSQFFIMLEDYDLQKAYTIFGEVTEGMDVVSEIQIGDIMTKVVIEDIGGEKEVDDSEVGEVADDSGAEAIAEDQE